MDELSNRTLTAVSGVAVGHAEDGEARTGCTVVVGPFRAAVDVRGLATGTRETDALSPLHVVPACDAILLTGGSAFGLAAADGVVRRLEEEGKGFETRAARVPIVPAAVVYDLAVGQATRRPDAEMGYRAAATAGDGPSPEGTVGVGAGATVGKLRGMEHAEPAGVGGWAERAADGSTVAALAVVNAFGDVLDGRGEILAGCRDERGDFLDTARALREGARPPGFSAPEPGSNTTLGVVATDLPLERAQLQVVARLAMNAIVRRVSPANTPFDGDVVFAVSTAGDAAGRIGAEEVLVAGLRAQAALERAIERSVRR